MKPAIGNTNKYVRLTFDIINAYGIYYMECRYGKHTIKKRLGNIYECTEDEIQKIMYECIGEMASKDKYEENCYNTANE